LLAPKTYRANLASELQRIWHPNYAEFDIIPGRYSELNGDESVKHIILVRLSKVRIARAGFRVSLSWLWLGTECQPPNDRGPYGLEDSGQHPTYKQELSRSTGPQSEKQTSMIGLCQDALREERGCNSFLILRRVC
jgi:hypothetical protein